MRKPNYAHEKRQRELEKQKKREEKRLDKLARKEQTTPGAPNAEK
jgi:hypothetical protein